MEVNLDLIDRRAYPLRLSPFTSAGIDIEYEHARAAGPPPLLRSVSGLRRLVVRIDRPPNFSWDRKRLAEFGGSANNGAAVVGLVWSV